MLDEAIVEKYRNLFAVGTLIQSGTPDQDEVDPLQTTIHELEEELQLLRSQLEAETSAEQRLSQQRDLAWNTFDTLSNKVAELSLERTAVNREVRLASPAVMPMAPIAGFSALYAAAIGGVTGLLVGIFVALLSSYLGKRPFLARLRIA